MYNDIYHFFLGYESNWAEFMRYLNTNKLIGLSFSLKKLIIFGLNWVRLTIKKIMKIRKDYGREKVYNILP